MKAKKTKTFLKITTFEPLLQNATVILHAAQLYRVELSALGITTTLIEKLRMLITVVTFANDRNLSVRFEDKRNAQELQKTMQFFCAIVCSHYAVGSAVRNFFCISTS